MLCIDCGTDDLWGLLGQQPPLLSVALKELAGHCKWSSLVFARPSVACGSCLILVFEAPITWMRTRELSSALGVHRNTLGNMLRQGLFREGVHRRKINPLAPRGEFLWNYEAVLMSLGRL